MSRAEERSVVLDGRTCHILRNGDAPGAMLYWGVMANAAEERRVLAAQLPSEQPWTLAVFEAADWNRDFSPWPAPAAFGAADFAGAGGETLDWLLRVCVPYVEADFAGERLRFLGGYSLAGLFSLWAFYESGAFTGAASCSGSLWYPDWEEYARNRCAPAHSRVYLSLGTREEHTRNAVMARVGDATRAQYDRLRADPNLDRCTLAWNPGGHFHDPVGRMAHGFTWLLCDGATKAES